MAESQITLTFVRRLHRALEDLYDPPRLQNSPLVGLCGIDPEDASASLQRLLLDAIEALKPLASVPRQGRAWRTHEVLFHRYVVQFSQGEVAQTLGLSLRQLRREDSRSLRVLADYVWHRYNLAAVTSESIRPRGSQHEPRLPSSLQPSREQELQFLGQSLPDEIVNIRDTVQAALETVAVLLDALQVQVEAGLRDDLPHVVCNGVALRHALLNTLTVAIRSVPGGRVTVEAEVQQRLVQVSILPTTLDPSVSNLIEVADDLEMTRQLLRLIGGTLDVTSAQRTHHLFVAHLRLPVAEELTVLVIDDNNDVLLLIERYLAGTRYAFIGSSDARQALQLAMRLKPSIVVLDVMIPGMDGWELLQRLREGLSTRHIPIIVHTILPEQQLAMAMGAALFLRKPVSRRDFLAALDRQLERPAPDSAQSLNAFEQLPG